MSTPLLENILNQPQALEAVCKHQVGEGLPALKEAAQLIASKRRVVLSGMGASCFACLPFSSWLAENDIHAITVETAELLYFSPSLIDKETVVVLVSRSGESVEVVKLLPFLRARGAAVIGVVNVPGSTLSLASDVSLTVGSPADQFVAIQTFTGTVALFGLLAAEVSRNLEQAQSELASAIELLRSYVPACVSASDGWKEFLERKMPLYILGRGAAMGAVTEGVLLMHETAKTAAVGMSVAQFRHGPVEVVDAEFRAVVVGTQAATAQLEAALASDLTEMGGSVRWIGPPVKGAELNFLIDWPRHFPQRYSAIAEIIPLQMMAYRTAEFRGVRPGEFRWAPLVTKTESGFGAGSSS